MQRGTFQFMKSVNKSIILNKIRTDGPISRAQIAKETKLTPPTVSSMVKELLLQNLVTERELGNSSGGRKPTLLEINSKAYYVIGVDAGPEHVVSVLTDLSGRIQKRTESRIPKPVTQESFLSLLINDIGSLLAVKGAENVIGAGVAMHGVVDPVSGTSLMAPILQLRDMPMKRILEDALSIAVKVENDARAMALGESWFGGNDQLDSLVAVNIGRGVGAGIVMNGRLYHGAQAISGELGHMTIDMNGERCACGNQGCLQTIVSGPAIVNQAVKQGLLRSAEASGADLFELAKAGNKAAQEIFIETGKTIGIGLTNLIHLLNPGKIVLGGGVMKGQQFLMPMIKETIKNRVLATDAKDTSLSVSELGDDATTLGAVALVLVDLFDPVAL